VLQLPAGTRSSAAQEKAAGTAAREPSPSL
jgi:hypothetical protein